MQVVTAIVSMDAVQCVVNMSDSSRWSVEYCDIYDIRACSSEAANSTAECDLVLSKGAHKCGVAPYCEGLAVAAIPICTYISQLTLVQTGRR